MLRHAYRLGKRHTIGTEIGFVTHRVKLNEERILELYARIESEAQKVQYIKYREILKEVLRQFGGKLSFEPAPSELDCLVDSLGDWKPFPYTVQALRDLKSKFRFRLAIISNIDDDLFQNCRQSILKLCLTGS